MRDPASGACILIDDAGRRLRWPQDRRRITAGRHDPDFDFPDYAVRNLGFAMIAQRKDAICVRLRPAFCGRRTAMSLLALAGECTDSRAAIAYFGRSWSHEVCSGGAPLQRRLLELLGEPADEPSDPPFIAVPRRLSGMLRDTGNPFAPVLRRWLDNVQPGDIRDVLESHRLYDRCMIVERRPDTGAFVFRHSGAGLQLYSSGWASSAVGRHLHEQPDHAYGRWIAEACRAVDDGQVPRYELISARVAPDGRDPRPWRYERLMLPWRGSDGARLVVSVSVRDQLRNGLS
jgi:hypothetical protein